ncbi:YaiI/YqxD family protein [Metabacillus fastidiosus]|uniref:YaiI/YqxD family protein n=1 Tax=Metabacillus fastidiosus TaxID=1458 RepID=UPI002DB655E1|nr:YaiI/YqxD family protein [Metabacillus fastidiosus]MEC2076529.1 YaiI/YqxD family protein [Metabacillus fastidiosus]MED4530750.1 YaiI/YqxD family protein [Metabacillus fastidiosus]
MKVFVDADACPVKQEIVSVASKYHFEVVFVASYNHLSDKKYGGDWVFVDTGKEAADLYIVNNVRKNNVVVTQDIGLAGLLLKKDVHIVTPRGKQYTEHNIETALQFRYLSAKERRRGKYLKGPKRFTDEDLLNFIMTFEKMLSKLAGDLK